MRTEVEMSLVFEEKTIIQKKLPNTSLRLSSKRSGASRKVSAPKKKKRYKTISFFSGCGGLDLGFLGGFDYKGERFSRNAFEIIKAYDIDPKCIKTYTRNIQGQIVVGNLSNYDPYSIPAADVLIGGFPCQDFATCGPKKGLKSKRGKLYKALMRYMEAHSPMVVVGENVPGLANINNGTALKKIIKDFESCGYQFEVWTLYAPDYGVPQNRTRLFIVGVRNDLPDFPEYPKPKFADNHRTIKWAIEDLESIEDDTVPNQSQHFKASKAKKGNGQGDEISKVNLPSYTIRANAKSRVQFHYKLKRRLTVRECARLQTFPDNFHFPHSATTNIMQIGNAVPPVLAHKIAQQISRYLKKVK